MLTSGRVTYKFWLIDNLFVSEPKIQVSEKNIFSRAWDLDVTLSKVNKQMSFVMPLEQNYQLWLVDNLFISEPKIYVSEITKFVRAWNFGVSLSEVNNQMRFDKPLSWWHNLGSEKNIFYNSLKFRCYLVRGPQTTGAKKGKEANLL